jgi:hypothetical protein
MRLSVRDFGFKVNASPESARPVRLRLGGLTYCMSTPEALELANQLADVVGEVRIKPREDSTR